MSQVFETQPKLGDLIKMELDYSYCRDAGQFPVGSPIDTKVPTSLLGYPVVRAANGDCVPVIAGAENTTNGLVLLQKRNSSDLVADVGGFPVLGRGPAMVNKAAIPTVDYDGANLDLDAVAAALLALGVKVLDEHSQTTTQTI